MRESPRFDNDGLLCVWGGMGRRVSKKIRSIRVVVVMLFFSSVVDVQIFVVLNGFGERHSAI